MATFIDEQYYKSQIRRIQKKLERWDTLVSSFENLRFVPNQLNRLKKYPENIERLLNKALKVRGQEMEAELKLENPSERMYDTLSSIYGGFLYYDLPDAIVVQVFPTGRPERKHTPPAELHLVLQRLNEFFEDTLKEHPITKEKAETIKKLLDEWDRLAESERTAEQGALQSRAELAKANQEFSQEESVLRHLARADNVYVDGIHSALFPTAKTKADEEQSKEPGENPPAKSTDEASTTNTNS